MKKVLVSISCLVALVAARGDIIPSFVSATPSGTTTVWSYQIDITVDEEVTTGDFFTIYDFGSFVAGSNVQPAGWTFSSSLVGATPNGVVPPDDTASQNITWTYSGPAIQPGSGIGPFSISTAGAQSEPAMRLSYFASQATNTTRGNSGTKMSNVGQISVPAPVPVPEPTTTALMILGATGVAVRALRRRK